jgi:hypothetical protein
MNKNKSNKGKLTDSRLKELELRVAEADKMPLSVATDLLCDCGRRMSNAERKTYLRSRQRELLSTRLRKPRAVKLNTRMQNATILQLLKWESRAAKSRRGLQHRYHVLLQMPNTLPVQAMIQAIDWRAMLTDSAIDIMHDELVWRTAPGSYSAQR